MISKLSIQKFGIFEGFDWNRSVGSEAKFVDINIFYGRNYSGKTTLSNVFKSIEDKRLSSKFENASFDFTFYNGDVLLASRISESSLYKIRVFNQDYIKENLSWLRADNGEIRPFAILGSHNVEIEKRISEIDSLLGSEEKRLGLLFELQGLKKRYEEDYGKIRNAENELNDMLKSKARDIKVDTFTYNSPVYNINNIVNDITCGKDFTSVSEEFRHDLVTKISEEDKGSLQNLSIQLVDIRLVHSEILDLVNHNIIRSEPIAELLNNRDLQEWVRNGIKLHGHTDTVCGFCGSDIAAGFWDRLRGHFNEDSELHLEKLKIKFKEVEGYRMNIKEKVLNIYSKEKLFTHIHHEITPKIGKLLELLDIYDQEINYLLVAITDKIDDVFNSHTVRDITDPSKEIEDIVTSINDIIKQHNDHSNSLSKRKAEARQILRLCDAQNYGRDIKYNQKNEKINQFRHELEVLREQKNSMADRVTSLIGEKHHLSSQLKNESKGAELVNTYLSHFFGHTELRLVADEVDGRTVFSIRRNHSPAFNMSEGECSLVAFCYFIAKIDDDLNADNDIDKTIIFIDDPISSLDSNHVFFMFGIIDALIVRPKKFKQLFISTHNLDFLKYLKRLRTSSEVKTESYLVERLGHTSSVRPMPRYLKKSTTEFLYLFHIVYSASQNDIGDIDDALLYGFGNNLRKFLESYLYFKYPNYKKLGEKIDSFFKEDVVAATLINRAINEYSHLEEQFDRGLDAVDFIGMQKVAKLIMQKIEAVDKEQYDAMVESIK